MCSRSSLRNPPPIPRRENDERKFYRAVTGSSLPALPMLYRQTLLTKIMKRHLLFIALAGAVQLAVAQEQLPREEALKYALAVSLDLSQLQGTPIPTDVDLKRPVALRDGEYGGLFLPESKLSAQSIANAGEKIVPIGQLWLHRLTPVLDNQPVSTEKLRMANVSIEGSDVRVPQLTLGVRKTSAGELELVVLGKTADPVVAVPLAAVETKSQDPLSLEAERDSSGATATVVLFGKFKAQLSFTELES